MNVIAKWRCVIENNYYNTLLKRWTRHYKNLVSFESIIIFIYIHLIVTYRWIYILTPIYVKSILPILKGRATAKCWDYCSYVLVMKLHVGLQHLYLWTQRASSEPHTNGLWGSLCRFCFSRSWDASSCWGKGTGFGTSAAGAVDAVACISAGAMGSPSPGCLLRPRLLRRRRRSSWFQQQRPRCWVLPAHTKETRVQ